MKLSKKKFPCGNLVQEYIDRFIEYNMESINILQGFASD